MIEKILLFLPFYFAVSEAGEYCLTYNDRLEYCSNGCCSDSCCFAYGYVGGGIGGFVALILLIICCCCVRRRRLQQQGVIVYGQGPSQTIAVNQVQYPVHSGLNQVGGPPGAGYSQPVPARFEPMPFPQSMPYAQGHQQMPAGGAPVQKPEAQATSTPPPYQP